jgi:exodeoxyribonuclease V alpha subunit
MPTLEGILERITFYNDKTLFMVARLRLDNDALCTVIGNMPHLGVGEKLRLQGDWSLHPDYGQQFRIQSYEVLMPSNLKGIRRFLASGLIRGVGPATADKIVDCFGPATLEIIEKEPLRLTEVDGIGGKKAAMISASLCERREVMKVMSFLQGYGVGTGYATKIYRRYGDDTIARVTENPYRMAEDVFGIGFRTADKIALEMGLAADSPHRIRAALLYLLNRAQDDGHLYLPRQELTDRVIQALGTVDNCGEAAVDEQLGLLIGDGNLIMERLDGEDGIYLAHLFQAEHYVAERLRNLAEFQLLLSPDRVSQETGGLELAEGQRKAVSMAVESGLLVVTGGPGTGKTTTIKTLLELFQRHGLEVMLAAPTGRAAKRMTEATGMEAKTIHRLLEYTYMDGKGYSFLRDDTRPLKAHVVIVDEVSMVDLILFFHLLKAIPPGCRLVLVGDMDQLPSVGAGNVLRDIISSGAVPVARLDRIFRQVDSSTIITNAHRVNTGQMPLTESNSSDFYFMHESDPEVVVDMILELCSLRLPRYRNRDAIDDIQVLSPMRRNTLGVDNLNLKLQQELNPPAPHKAEIRVGGTHFRLGDKVMQIRNNYQKEVFNGDIGRIIHVNSDDGEIHVCFPDVGGDREIIYDITELEELVLSYAVSVHKSQGSEYPVVVLPVVTQHYIMLQRNLLYTAITRAKELVVLIGTKKALAIAVSNNKVEARYTRLSTRLASKKM